MQANPKINICSEVRDAIRAILAKQDRSWSVGDAAAFAGSAAPDIVFTNVMGIFSVGRAPFEAHHARIFASNFKGSRLEQSLVHIALVRPDVAIVDTLLDLTGYSHLPPGSEGVDGVFKTRSEQVMVLEDGRWWVASFHNVPVNPVVLNVASPT